MNEAETPLAIAHRLRATREALGLSQAEVARRIGVSPNRYNQWETGAQRVSIDGALMLCRTFKMSLDWIYRGDAASLPFDLGSRLTKLINHAS